MPGTRACFAALMLLSLAGAARGEIRQLQAVRLHAETHVAAAPAAVWQVLTTGRNFATWCPQWKAPANARVSLTRVGDVVSFTDAWNNSGRSVVTYLVPNRELRVAHEPNDGSYLCRARVTLTPSNGGTLVHFWDEYTDENPNAADRDATARKEQAALGEQLAALKKLAEK